MEISFAFNRILYFVFAVIQMYCDIWYLKDLVPGPQTPVPGCCPVLVHLVDDDGSLVHNGTLNNTDHWHIGESALMPMV